MCWNVEFIITDISMWPVSDFFLHNDAISLRYILYLVHYREAFWNYHSWIRIGRHLSIETLLTKMIYSLIKGYIPLLSVGSGTHTGIFFSWIIQLCTRYPKKSSQHQFPILWWGTLPGYVLSMFAIISMGFYGNIRVCTDTHPFPNTQILVFP